MKKSCKNCKALTLTGCSIKYKCDYTKTVCYGVEIRNYYPLEECPKPKTISEAITWANVRRNYKQV